MWEKEVRYGIRQIGKAAAPVHGLPFCQLCDIRIGQHCGRKRWPMGVYETALKSAKYVDLTHTITPRIPVWVGFAESTFSPAKAGADLKGFARKGEVYTAQKHDFEATEYTLRTDRPARHAARSAGALGTGIPDHR